MGLDYVYDGILHLPNSFLLITVMISSAWITVFINCPFDFLLFRK